MAMVSLKTEGKEHDMIEDSKYGWGTRLCLTSDQCAALGITTPPPAGAAVTIVAKATITRTTEEAEVEGDEPNEVYLELQLTDMELRQSDGALSAATVLYGPTA